MRRTLLLASLLFGCAGAACAGQIYKWVDAQGVTHFTAQPPQSAEASVIPTAKQPAASKPAATPPAASSVANDPKQAEIDARVRQEVAQKEKELDEYCTTLRTNLAQLHNNRRVRMKDGDGEARRLTQDERQAKITETEKAIAENCQ